MERSSQQRIFLLSPARTDGQRAQMVMRQAARFDLANRLRQHGAPLGEIFSFMSGLYFRGKLVYANRFAAAEHRWVITSSRGLVSPDMPVTRQDLQALSKIPIDHLETRYTEALQRDAERLLREAGKNGLIVLLGSIASAKYVDPLMSVLGDQLVFPVDFVGRGDLSRGGLLLRAAQSGNELPYVPVKNAIRKGRRPPQLAPLSKTCLGFPSIPQP